MSNEELFSELKTAVENNDVAKVGKLLFEVGDVCKFVEGKSLLYYVENLEIAKLLIKYGADPKEKGILTGKCVGNGHYDVVRYLIENGADVNTLDDEGVTPLIVATICYDAKMMKILLDNGANVKATDNEGMSAMSVAKLAGEKFLIEVLKRKHTDEEIEAYIRGEKIKEVAKASWFVMSRIVNLTIIVSALIFAYVLVSFGMLNDFRLFLIGYLMIVFILFWIWGMIWGINKN